MKTLDIMNDDRNSLLLQQEDDNTIIYESEYRRQALQSWSNSNEETKKEMIQEIRNNYQITTNLFKKIIFVIASVLRYRKST